MGTETKATGGLVAAAAVVVVLAGLKLAAPALLPLLLGLVGAILALPFLTWLQARRVPSGLAVLLIALAGFALLAVVLVTVERSLASFLSIAPRYEQRLEDLADEASAWLGSHGIEGAGHAIKHVVDPAALMKLLQVAASAVAGIFSQAVLIFLVAIFILLEMGQIARRIRTAAAGNQRAISRYTETIRQVQRYLGLKTLVCLANGVLTGSWAALLGVDFAALWGLLSFILGYIPNIGALLATIPPVLVAFLQLGPKRAIATLAGYVVIKIVIGDLIEPRLMGKSFGISPLAILLALLFWGWLWGPVGMFLSVPLLVVLKIVFDNVPDLRWLGELLGTAPEGAPPP